MFHECFCSSPYVSTATSFTWVLMIDMGTIFKLCTSSLIVYIYICVCVYICIYKIFAWLLENQSIFINESASHLVMPDFCNSMNCSPPGSSVRGILQAKILEWVAIPFSRGSSQPRDQTTPPTLQADSLGSEKQGKPHLNNILNPLTKCP